MRFPVASRWSPHCVCLERKDKNKAKEASHECCTKDATDSKRSRPIERSRPAPLPSAIDVKNAKSTGVSVFETPKPGVSAL